MGAGDPPRRGQGQGGSPGEKTSYKQNAAQIMSGELLQAPVGAAELQKLTLAARALDEVFSALSDSSSVDAIML